MPRTIIARAPARIDLAGGWTDVPPYTTDVGGAVCNVAIESYAVATVHQADGATPPADALPRAAWRRAGEPAVTVTLASEVPVGSGLGGSSAAGVALAAALDAWNGGGRTPHELAELSRSTETETMGLAGGCQDHFAAAFGGALLLECAAQTTVSQITLSDATTALLESRGIIAYTGESRMSANTITAVIDKYRDGDVVTCDALRTMAALAPQMATALADGDLDRLGTLLSRQWAAQRALHATITTPLIDTIVAAAAHAGALGTKALGASGGGCVFVLAAAGREEAVRAAVARHASLLPFRVARLGVQIHDSGTPD
jgi:D-glycero-alpha-D-manno-heptose-7-phosphate kinase